MKMKSFAMAAAGLLAASLGAMTPAMADDTTTGQAMQQPAAPADTTNTATAPTPDQSAQQNADSTDNNGSNGSDAGTPDTATGDDDY